MAFDVHEKGASGSQGSIQLIDVADKEQEAPFAVREADGSTGAVSGRLPDKAEILAWLEGHPVVVGVATGVLCFSIIAAALTTVLGSDSGTDTDDPVAGAALSETDGGQGSFSSSGSGGANFTSDESKLSRTGAGKIIDESADDETAVGPTGRSTSPSGRTTKSTDPAGPSNLDQSASLSGRTPVTGSGTGQSAGPGSSGGPVASSSIPDPTRSPTTAGSPATTLNPGPNPTGPTATTATTSRVTASIPVSIPTTATTAGQGTSTAPTTAATTPTTPAPTTPTTPAPSADLSIVAPGDGSSHMFEAPTNFAVGYVPGATQYCWTFIQNGVTAIEACSGATTYQLPARPSPLGPGLVTVRATASGPFGTISDTIQISLYRTRVINNPTRDLVIGQSPLRVGVVNLIGATQYCFRITQSGYDSGSLCYSTPGYTFNKNHPIFDSLEAGPLTVTATIYGGSLMLAVDSVTIQLS